MTPEIWILLFDTRSIDHFRVPLSDRHLAIMEAEGCDDEILANAQEWVDVEFEVALDSGSTDNGCHEGTPLTTLSSPQLPAGEDRKLS